MTLFISILLCISLVPDETQTNILHPPSDGVQPHWTRTNFRRAGAFGCEMSLKRKDITGQRFGRLTAISFVEMRNPSGRHQVSFWLCRCDCGVEVVANMTLITSGATRSCGCLRAEMNRIRWTKHGHSPDRNPSTEYRSWQSAKNRTSNPKNEAWDNYGGRGIRMCLRWNNSFDDFLLDMGHKPTPKHSIDRKNNNGHYSCGKCSECNEKGWASNCKWATRKEQNNNRRDNAVLVVNGDSRKISQWADINSIRPGVIKGRLRGGWPAEKAVTTPVRKITDKRPFISVEQKKSILKMAHSDGLSDAEIAPKFGVLESRIRQIRKSSFARGVR